jgi:hypothetical protein
VIIGFYEGKCQQKYSSTELKPEKFVTFSPDSRVIELECKLVALREQVHRRPAGGARQPLVSTAWLSLLLGMDSGERPGAVQAALVLRGEAEP